MDNVQRAAENFRDQGKTITRVEKYGHGIIHDTFLVTLDSGPDRFILQRINTRVFKDPAAIMHNLQLVCECINNTMQSDTASTVAADWQIPSIIPTADGKSYFTGTDGSVWRALCFISGARPLEHVSGPGDTLEAGRALGIFHWLTGGLDPDLLRETLPGFHDIGAYFNHYDQAVGRRHKGPGEDYFCQRFIEERRDWATVLKEGVRDGLLAIRVIHGDPKSNNIMVDKDTGRAVSMIDLDTVMAGPLQYDIGDCLRSCCNTVGETDSASEASGFDLARLRAFWQGYSGVVQHCLTDVEATFIFEAVRLLPFELGLRFYTDFLENNVYFKVSRPGQNLDRALVQFRLVESIEEQEKEIREIIAP
jgi:hypothetical protein